MQRAAMACAARCVDHCTALRHIVLHTAPSLAEAHGKLFHHTAPVRAGASHFSRKESGKPRQCFWTERASGRTLLFSFLRKNPHPTVRDLTKHSERSSIRLPETSRRTPKESPSTVRDLTKHSERSSIRLPKTSRRTPKESSFICQRTPCVLRRKLHLPALLRRVSACCSLYRSTRGCQAGGRWV